MTACTEYRCSYDDIKGTSGKRPTIKRSVVDRVAMIMDSSKDARLSDSAVPWLGR